MLQISQLSRLSLCMIVKNEEDCIGRCLQSVHHVVDEMIIVDTGSTDRTVEICKSFGATVLEFSWNGSFADARNYGIERASGDWILWLDADEEVDETCKSKLRDAMYFDDYDLFNIQLINYYGDEVDADKVLNVAHTRLFRNGIGLKFVYPIHETLNVLEILPTAEEQKRIGLIPVSVHHYGYMTPVVEKKDKFERNLRMLELEATKEDCSPWIDYHIASEYYRVPMYEKAFESCNRSIIRFILLGLTPPALVYKLKYSILLSLGSWDGAWPGIDRAISLYPDYVDLHFYKGVILYYKGMYPEALEAFEQCLSLGEDNLNYLVLRGLGSFQACYYKGLTLEKLEQWDQAALCYVQSLQMSHSFRLPIDALLELEKAGHISKAALLEQIENTGGREELKQTIQDYEKNSGGTHANAHDGNE